MSDCYVCGDGVELINGNWRHSDDLGISMDSAVVAGTCYWGKPYKPHEPF